MTDSPPKQSKDAARKWGHTGGVMLIAGWFCPLPERLPAGSFRSPALAAPWFHLPGATLAEACAILTPLLAGILAIIAARTLEPGRRGRAMTGLAVAVLAAPFVLDPREQFGLSWDVAREVFGPEALASLTAFAVSLTGIGLIGRHPDRLAGRVLAALGGTALLGVTVLRITSVAEDALTSVDAPLLPTLALIALPGWLVLCGYGLSCVVAALRRRDAAAAGAAGDSRRLAVTLLVVVVAGVAVLGGLLFLFSREMSLLGGRVLGIGGGVIILLASGLADWLRPPGGRLNPASAARP